MYNFRDVIGWTFFNHSHTVFLGMTEFEFLHAISLLYTHVASYFSIHMGSEGKKVSRAFVV